MAAPIRIAGAEFQPVGPRQRTLSKSDFKLARTCDAKLFFRENGYPDNRESDPYLAMLARGGYMVEALAKARHKGGVQLEYGRNLAGDVARTLEYLQRDEVTLFEATLVAGRRQARVDILQKKGTVVRLLEVKAKLFDSAEHAERPAGIFRNIKPPHGICADWAEKLEDITFQVLLLEHMLPGITVEPYLVLVDKAKRSAIDNVPSLFELVLSESGRLQTARYVGSDEGLAALDLLTEVDVSKEVALLRDEVERAAAKFEARLDAPLAVHIEGLERGSKCSKCEFRREGNGDRDGFGECWGQLAEAKPHVLELYKVGLAKSPDRTALVGWMWDRKTAGLLDVPLDGLVVKDPAKPGGDAVRQRRQIEYTRCGQVYIGPELRRKVEALRGPMHFIDFETSRIALPYHRGMRPYGLVAFQWSCHTVTESGGLAVHSDWLNNIDVWPNQQFVESLRDAIGDAGPVLTWSPFEGATLQDIKNDFAKFDRQVPELVAWITDVVENRIVDLHDWARCDYYHPGMRGRTSIKVVLEALWKSDERMRADLETWSGLRFEADADPYLSLPPVEINGKLRDVHEGTGAMDAYQEMMYGAHKHDPAIKAKWAGLLKQYCSLDTLSMVLIFEHWRRLVGLAS